MTGAIEAVTAAAKDIAPPSNLGQSDRLPADSSPPQKASKSGDLKSEEVQILNWLFSQRAAKVTVDEVAEHFGIDHSLAAYYLEALSEKELVTMLFGRSRGNGFGETWRDETRYTLNQKGRSSVVANKANFASSKESENRTETTQIAATSERLEPKALEILKLCFESPDGVAVEVVAQKFGLIVKEAQYYLDSLNENGLVEYNEPIMGVFTDEGETILGDDYGITSKGLKFVMKLRGEK